MQVTAKTSTATSLVKMEKIYKHFGGVVALHNVDFDLNYNEIVGLVGDNGAGKSTLIKILSGALTPDGGKIYFEGNEVEISNPKIAKELGIETVYQDLALVENLDVASNLFLGREFKKGVWGKLFGVIDKKRTYSEAEKVMRNLKIRIDSVKTIVQNLSGGQRQAVAIGKTVYLSPKVIIMDEPTAAIGVKEREVILDLTLSLKEKGISVIFISHNIPEVFSVADRIVVLNRGVKVGDEKASNLTVDDVVKLLVGS